jgi:hypothetical protein
MSLLDLANKLRAEAARGPIPINTQTLTVGTGMQLPSGLNLDTLIRDSFHLDAGQQWLYIIAPSAIPDPVGKTLTIRNGRSSFLGLSLTNVVVDLEFQASGPNAATLDFAAPVDLGQWQFQTSFQYMTGYPYSVLPYTSPAFVFSTQPVAAYPWKGRQVALAEGQNFSSLITLTGVLQDVTAFLIGSPLSPIPLYGAIDVKEINKAPTLLPQFVFKAPIPATLEPILSLRIQQPFVGMRLTNVTVTREGQKVLQQRSNFYFGMTLTVGDASQIELDFITKILKESSEVELYVASSPDKPMTPEALFELMAGESWVALVPAELRQFLNLVMFQDLSVTMQVTGSATRVTAIQATVGSTKEWNLFGDFTIKQFEVNWRIVDPGADSASTISFYARFEFFKSLFPGDFEVNITSDLLISGKYVGEVRFSDLVNVITQGAIVLPNNQATLDFGFQNFELLLDYRQKKFMLGAEAFATLDIMGNTVIQLDDVRFQLVSLPQPGSSTAREYTGLIQGTLYFLDFGVFLSAEYRGAVEGWFFLGSMQPDEELPLGQLLNKLFAAARLPQFLSDDALVVRDVVITASPATQGKAASSYSGSGKLQLFDTQLGWLGRFSALTDLEITYTSDGSASVTQGSFAFQTIIQGIGVDFVIRYRFNTAGSDILGLEWGVFSAEYNTASSQITFRINGSSFGEMLVAFVKMVTGDDDFRLPSPWSLLNEISLRGFQVVFELAASRVTLRYTLTNAVNLGFATIRGFEFRKNDNGVVVALDATFLDGSTVPPFNPLTGTPNVPTGNALVDLRLLAMGQHVTVEGINLVKNMNQAIEALSQFHENPTETLPVGGPNQPAFDPNNSWLIGMHFLVLGATLELKLVFLDPVLYGLRIALSGEKAKIFAGLQFEILYRRVTDSIGVYQLELKLPDRMRYLDFGALSVVLPVVGVEIYTNGNFRIDFGFPFNNSFARSFSVSWFPFTGAGGFYFGYLNSATSERVPRTTKGIFDPVLEFGIGVQIGLGKQINKGIFKAGISITAVGILEGVIAVWRPNQPALAGASDAAVAIPNGDVQQGYYYRVQGAVGVIGKIYGSVDFSIVQADVNLVVSAYIQATIEAYRPTVIYLEAGVTVSLTVRVNLGLFKISVHLSFSTTIKERFELGRRQIAPWDDPAALTPARIARSAAARRQRAVEPRFSPLGVGSAERTIIDLYMAVQGAAAGDPTNKSTTKATMVTTFYIDAPQPASSGNTESTSADKTSFERFAEEVFLWSAYAFWDQKPAGGIGRAEFAGVPLLRDHVASAFEYLSANTEARPISYRRDIVPGLFQQLKFVIHQPQAMVSTSAFPMIPDLRMIAPGVDIAFNNYARVDQTYLDELRAYFQLLMAQYQNELERQYAGTPKPAAKRADAESPQPFAEVIFEDFTLMVARYMLQAGVDAFESFGYPYQGQSITAIVNAINSIHDPASGTSNHLTAEEVAFANRELPLSKGVHLKISAIHYQIENGQTLGSIAAVFRADAAKIVREPLNAALGGLLREGAVLALPAGPYAVRPNDTIDTVRANAPATYEQIAGALLNHIDALVPLMVIVIPDADYTLVEGDTLEALADNFGVGYDTLARDAGNTPNLFLQTVGSSVYLTLPNLEVMTSNDLLADMASKYGIDNLAGMAARFLLYGLRPLVNQHIQLPASSECAQQTSCALYSVSGQQFDLPAIAPGWTTTLRTAVSYPWLVFDSLTPDQIAVVENSSIVDWTRNLVATAQKYGMQARLRSIQQLPGYRDEARRDTFRTNIPLQSASPLNYPVDNDAGSLAPGPRVWLLPAGLMDDAASAKKLPPLVSLRIATTEEITNAGAAQRYGWSMLLDVEVKRMRIASDSPEIFPNTYEFVGAGNSGIRLLEQYLGSVGRGTAASIDGMYIFYRPNVSGQTPGGLESSGMDRLTAFLVKANLSTETNPGLMRAVSADGDPSRTGILNQPTDFLRLAWEASITRSGGFYLYFRLSDGGTGLPDYLFNQNDTAQISILVVFKHTADRIAPYFNAVLIGDTIDPSANTVFAQSQPQSVKHILQKDDSFASLMAAYRVPLTTLSAAARDLLLVRGGTVPVKIREIYHQVQAPDSSNPKTESLAEIAAHYVVAPQAIRDANPGVNFDPLAYWTVLRIPDIDRILAPNDPLDTLARVAAYYGVSVDSLAFSNVDNTSLLAPGSLLDFPDHAIDRSATIPPGNAGFRIERENPAGDENDPAVYLQSAFNLLGFAMAANTAFSATSEGLPIGPTRPMAPGELKQSRRRRMMATAGEPWVYEQVLSVAPWAKFKGLPNGEGNPYSGVGSVAQVHLRWRDLFGNLIASPLTQPEIGPRQPMNNLPLRIGYSDPLLGPGLWPSVLADYSFAREGAANVLSVNFAFDASRYDKSQPSGDPDSPPAWQQHALADLQTYRTIYSQVNQLLSGGAPSVQFTLTTSLDNSAAHVLTGANRAHLINLVDQAIQFLKGWLGEGPEAPVPPPRAVKVEVPDSAANPNDIFQLAVTITTTRPVAQVDLAFRGDASVERCVSEFNPRLGKVEGVDAQNTVSLSEFARSFESAYVSGDLFLKVATGDSRDPGAPLSQARRIWVTRFRTTSPLNPAAQGIYFKIDGPGMYFAPRPLANVLISRKDIPVHPYRPQTGVDWNTTIPTSFTSIDLDVWGRQALAAIDLILSPQFSIPAFMVDYLDPEHGNYLQRILNVKGELADAITATVEPILQEPPVEPANLAAAKEKMRQQLLSRLENAYLVTAIAEWNARVHSHFTAVPGRPAPRFYGTPAPTLTGDVSPAATKSYVFSNAKPPLSNGVSHLTAAFSSTNPSGQTSYDLNLDYKITNLEHQINAVPGIENYEASAWLTFVIPLDPDPSRSATPTVDSRIGPATIPVVLKVFPEPPSLVSQSGIQRLAENSGAATTLEQAKLWDYQFIYAKSAVAQDTIDAEARFNLPDQDGIQGASARALDLFDYLGIFVSAYPGVERSMIDLLRVFPLDSNPTSDGYKRVVKVLSDFYQLVAPLPMAWKEWRREKIAADLTANATPASAYYFSVQERRDDSNGRLVLTRTLSDRSDAKVYNPATHTLVPLPPPQITIDVNGTIYRMAPGPEPASFYFIDDSGQYLDWNTAKDLPNRAADFAGLNGAGLDVMGYQNAWSAVQIVRNRDLVRRPDGTVVPTNPAFIYSTQQIRFAGKLTPLLQTARPIDVAAITAQRYLPLQKHLENLFMTFFNALPMGAEQMLRMECQYSYLMADNPDLPPIVLPVFLRPPFLYRVAPMPTPFVTATATLISQWNLAAAPQVSTGKLLFDLTIFPVLTGSRLPLIRLTGLFLLVRDIAW